MNILIGAAMLAVGGILIFIGRPNRTGEHPKFLRFEAALVLYPPIVLSFIGLGAAALISSLLTR
ncbi:hypothetical protein [Bradyrhizobium sp. 192]|uniref:hypothetical protein n=1 Tax=Bradyrhizobium sp. 192 TaxID=2782660 RepID=UPI0020000C42|nr:hypothetical protein [Bradyrhizobium sp. 192]UPJ56159.1 hypothetical protein IVB24_26495 [Bradyrhizobium sp. 192]